MKKSSMFKGAFVRLTTVLVLLLVCIFCFAGCDDVSAGFNSSSTVQRTQVQDGDFVLSVLDVGDGAAQIVECDGKIMVVDVGDRDDTEYVRDCLESLGVSYFDVVILSHGHSDHMGGYNALKGYDIGTAYVSPQSHDTSTYEKAMDMMYTQSDKVVMPEPGDTFDLGSATVQFLGPENDNYDDLNNSSLVVRITYGENSFLLPGDMEGVEADEVMDRFSDLDTDVYIAAHHGSNQDRTNSYLLLREVNPKYVIISSAGKQSEYGFPHREVLSRINDLGAEIYRTDLLGDVVVTSDGKNISFNGEKPADNQNHSDKNGLADGGKYVGNINSKKFHLPSCGNLPAEQNRAYFETRESALSSGYEPCGQCRP